MYFEKFQNLFEKSQDLKENSETSNFKKSEKSDFEKAVAGEIVDVVILGINIIDYLGDDPENAILEKASIVFKQSNTKRLNELLAQGLSLDI